MTSHSRRRRPPARRNRWVLTVNVDARILLAVAAVLALVLGAPR